MTDVENNDRFTTYFLEILKRIIRFKISRKSVLNLPLITQNYLTQLSSVILMSSFIYLTDVKNTT